MTKQLFEHVAMFGDIHFGQKHNSRIFNDDCEEFVNWFIAESKKRNIDTCICLGDWHHNRNSINVSTLNYTVSNISKLSKNFKQVFILAGNHDLFYREKREIHSLPMGKEFDNVTIVDDIMVIDDVALVPWLVEDEWKETTKVKSKYMFGHFEIPGFKMNAMIEMPDHGGINKTHFKHQDLVFSGHFHNRQSQGNIHYIGNPFGHNYGDAWDLNRGACFLEWDGKPEYVNYADGPRYITIDLSKLLDDPEQFLNEKTYLKVSMDIDISYEEASFLRETFISNYRVREFKLIPKKFDEVNGESNSDVEFETVDQIVISELTAINSDNFKKQKLIDIYNNL